MHLGDKFFLRGDDGIEKPTSVCHFRDKEYFSG